MKSKVIIFITVFFWLILSISGIVGFVESKKVNDFGGCKYDGELVNGAEYVNGKYTYRYKQRGFAYQNDAEWADIDSDGWGVMLTDRESTEPVSGKICSKINGKPIVSTSSMYAYSKASSIDLSDFDTSNVEDMNWMFSWSEAEEIKGLENINTSKVIDMSGMFNESKANVLDLSHFDTSNVTNMSSMFMNSLVETLNVSNFNTSKVTDMNLMFYQVPAEVLDVSSFDTSNVENMSYMFGGTKATEIKGLNKLNTSKVTKMDNMFEDTDAEVLDVSSFDTSNVLSMNYMFNKSSATEIKGLDKFNTKRVLNFGYMFALSKVSSLDLSSFEFGQLIYISQMFSTCSAKEVYVKDQKTLDLLKSEAGFIPRDLVFKIK